MDVHLFAKCRKRIVRQRDGQHGKTRQILVLERYSCRAFFERLQLVAVDGNTLDEDQHHSPGRENLLAFAEGPFIQGQVFLALAEAIYGDHVEQLQQPGMPGLFESIAPRQKMDGTWKHGPDDDGVQERVRVVGNNEYGTSRA